MDQTVPIFSYYCPTYVQPITGSKNWVKIPKKWQIFSKIGEMLKTVIKIAILAHKRQNQIKFIFPPKIVFKYCLKYLKLGEYHCWFIV